MERLVIILLLCVTSVLADSNELQVWRSMQVHKSVRSEPNVSGRIVGGTEVNIADYPYQLSLCRFDYHICGASVVASSVALTAAHCVIPKPSPEYITLKGGSSNRTDEQSSVFQATEIIEHPMYNRFTYNNDIAIVRIEGSFNGHENVAPIALHTSPISVSSSYPIYCTVSGWGLTSTYGDLAEILSAVRIPLVPYNECRRKWSPLPVTTSMTCAGEPRRDSCNGDSGGPLICKNRLYGIVSWGDNHCGSSYPGVYALIPSKEILHFINQYVPDPQSSND